MIVCIRKKGCVGRVHTLHTVYTPLSLSLTTLLDEEIALSHAIIPENVSKHC